MLSAAAALAQQPRGAMSMQMPDMNDPALQSKVVDGSANPELIPDLTAYRLYFIAMSEQPNPTAEGKLRQDAFLRRIGLNENDQVSLVRVLAEFKIKFGAMVAKYNASEEAAQILGAPSSSAAFLLQRDELIQQTRDGLSGRLSSNGIALLDAHIQSEKKRMKVAAGQGQ